MHRVQSAQTTQATATEPFNLLDAPQPLQRDGHELRGITANTRTAFVSGRARSCEENVASKLLLATYLSYAMRCQPGLHACENSCARPSWR
jgi:hypothetical protein